MVTRKYDVYQCNTPEEWIQTINNRANDEIHKFNEGVFKAGLITVARHLNKDRKVEVVENK